MEGKYVERVNLREQVAWVMEPGEEDTQMCAEDLVRMALAKLGAIGDNTPYIPAELSLGHIGSRRRHYWSECRHGGTEYGI